MTRTIRDMIRQPLEETELDTIERLLPRLNDQLIAKRFGIPVETVRLIRRDRYWKRTAMLHDVGERQKLTTREIAQRAGVSRATVQKRLDRGIVGADLLAPQHTLPRRNAYGEPIPQKVKLTPRRPKP